MAKPVLQIKGYTAKGGWWKFISTVIRGCVTDQPPDKIKLRVAGVPHGHGTSVSKIPASKFSEA